MPTIREFFDKADIKGKVVAARLENPRRPSDPANLYYHAVDSLGTIPPSVYLIEGMTAGKINCKGSVLVNYHPVEWINANSVQEADHAGSDAVVFRRLSRFRGQAGGISFLLPARNQANQHRLFGDKVSHAGNRSANLYAGGLLSAQESGHLEGVAEQRPQHRQPAGQQRRRGAVLGSQRRRLPSRRGQHHHQLFHEER